MPETGVGVIHPMACFSGRATNRFQVQSSHLIGSTFAPAFFFFLADLFCSIFLLYGSLSGMTDPGPAGPETCAQQGLETTHEAHAVPASDKGVCYSWDHICNLSKTSGGWANRHLRISLPCLCASLYFLPCSAIIGIHIHSSTTCQSLTANGGLANRTRCRKATARAQQCLCTYRTHSRHKDQRRHPAHATQTGSEPADQPTLAMAGSPADLASFFLLQVSQRGPPTV